MVVFRTRPLGPTAADRPRRTLRIRSARCSESVLRREAAFGRNKKLLGALSLTTRSKDLTRSFFARKTVGKSKAIREEKASDGTGRQILLVVQKIR